MNKKQYNNLLKDLTAVFVKHGFDPRALPVKGQKQVEDKIKNIKPYEYYHPNTYGSKNIFDEFVKTKNLKLVWARNSSRVSHYQLDPYAVAKISPDYCPVTGALIDYGIGYNQITDNPYFRPGIDHIIAVSNGGVKFGDINNIQIVSQHYNTIKSFGSSIECIKWANFELTTEANNAIL